MQGSQGIKIELWRYSCGGVHEMNQWEVAATGNQLEVRYDGLGKGW